MRAQSAWRRKRTKGLAVVALLAGAGLIAVAAPGVRAYAAPRPRGTAIATTDATATLSPSAFTEQWSVQLPAAIAQSSPIVDTLNGVRSVVVGAFNGKVYALNLANGKFIPGWPATDPGSVPIQSTPSINGTIVYVGTGDAGHPTPGGYLALNSNGTQRWYRTVPVTPGNPKTSGVQAGLTVGILQGVKTVVAGTLGQYEEELRSNNGAAMPSFPWFAADSEFSTPSIVNLYGNGHNYIVEGGESTAGNAYGVEYSSGGHIRVLSATGSAGKAKPSGGLVCQYNTTQGVESSPAVGGFLNGRATGIVVGTGITYQTASDSDKLIAVTPQCQLAWKAALNGSTLDSPALVDALGNGYLQVAEGTSTGQNTGSVYLLNGTNGQIHWRTDVGGQVIGGITSANLGTGYQDLVVPTTGGLYILDGRTGHVVVRLGFLAVALQSAPLVTEDADGNIGITVAGYNNYGGMIMHWEVSGTQGSLVNEAGAWPMFHHDPQLTGTTITPAKS